MSSERPGGPADVVPGDDEGHESHESTSHRRGRDRQKKKGSLLRELPVLLLVAFVLALVVKTFFVQAFFIPSGSMEQTLTRCTGRTGDRVLVNKVRTGSASPIRATSSSSRDPTPGRRRCRCPS